MTLNVVNTGHEGTADCNVMHGNMDESLVLVGPIHHFSRPACLFLLFKLHLVWPNAKTSPFNLSLVCRNDDYDDYEVESHSFRMNPFSLPTRQIPTVGQYPMASDTDAPFSVCTRRTGLSINSNVNPSASLLNALSNWRSIKSEKVCI